MSLENSADSITATVQDATPAAGNQSLQADSGVGESAGPLVGQALHDIDHHGIDVRFAARLAEAIAQAHLSSASGVRASTRGTTH